MPQPLEYQFAPAVIFAGVRVPIDELIDHLRVYIRPGCRTTRRA
ncbi:MAG: hypothetical protein ACM3RP_10745 [Chitinophagales bacterium]